VCAAKPYSEVARAEVAVGAVGVAARNQALGIHCVQAQPVGAARIQGLSELRATLNFETTCISSSQCLSGPLPFHRGDNMG